MEKEREKRRNKEKVKGKRSKGKEIGERREGKGKKKFKKRGMERGRGEAEQKETWHCLVLDSGVVSGFLLRDGTLAKALRVTLNLTKITSIWMLFPPTQLPQ